MVTKLKTSLFSMKITCAPFVSRILIYLSRLIKFSCCTRECTASTLRPNFSINKWSKSMIVNGSRQQSRHNKSLIIVHFSFCQLFRLSRVRFLIFTFCLIYATLIALCHVWTWGIFSTWMLYALTVFEIYAIYVKTIRDLYA